MQIIGIIVMSALIAGLIFAIHYNTLKIKTTIATGLQSTQAELDAMKASEIRDILQCMSMAESQLTQDGKQRLAMISELHSIKNEAALVAKYGRK